MDMHLESSGSYTRQISCRKHSHGSFKQRQLRRSNVKRHTNMFSSPRPYPLCMHVKLTVIVTMYVLLLLGDGVRASPACPTPCTCRHSNVTNTTAGGLQWPDSFAINCSNVGLSVLPANMSGWISSSQNNIRSSQNNISSSQNNISTSETIPLIQILDISHNNLTTARWQEMFYNESSIFPLVEDDNIKQTNDILSLNTSVVDGNTSISISNKLIIKVFEVDFSHNSIASLGQDDLGVLRWTLHLDLSQNQLDNVHTRAFSDLGDLTHLNLSHNRLQDLHNDTLNSLVNLHTLDISHNMLNQCLLPLLHGLSSLKYLFLNNNQFVRVSLPPLNLLTSFDISYNMLQYVPEFPSEKLPSLQTLRLSSNNITTPHKSCFINVDKLRHLSLDNNPIELSNLSSQTQQMFQMFSPLQHLTNLNLSHTPYIHLLPPTLLTPLAQLLTLDLSYSGLVSLPQLTFHGLPRLQHVYLTGNPLNCSCLNAWISEPTIDSELSHNQQFPNQSAFHNAQNLKCVHDNGAEAHISSSAALCNEVLIHNMTGPALVKLGGQMVLQCNVISEEPALIEWTTPIGRKLHYHSYHQMATQHLPSPDEVATDAFYHEGHSWHRSNSYDYSQEDNPNRVTVLNDGSLFVDYFMRIDPGAYKCRVSNARYNHTSIVRVQIDSAVRSIRNWGFLFGFFCAFCFLTLNLIYSIIHWIIRKVVNKRRRKTILHLLDNLNIYKSAQMSRIHENYSHQLSWVRTQYHNQRDKLHTNYTSQVTRVKRGCSNRVDTVRDNYNAKLTTLREYSSAQILQIRERANNQVVRIRDYGSSQLEGLRETVKLQQQHVIKLLDTMNLDNCRSIIDTECMRTESLIFDIDLLGDLDDLDLDDQTGSLMSTNYSTANSTPVSISILDEDSMLGRGDNVSEDLLKIDMDDPMDFFVGSNTDGLGDDSLVLKPFDEIVWEINSIEGSAMRRFNSLKCDCPNCKADNDSFFNDKKGKNFAVSKTGNNSAEVISSIKQAKTRRSLNSHKRQNQSRLVDLTYKEAIPLPTQTWALTKPPLLQQLVVRDQDQDEEEDTDLDFVTPETSPKKVMPRRKSAQIKLDINDMSEDDMVIEVDRILSSEDMGNSPETIV